LLVAPFSLKKWILANSITSCLGFGIGLVFGKIIFEKFIVFVIPFLVLVLIGQKLTLNGILVDINRWLKITSFGFLLGSIIATIQIFLLLRFTDLITNHLIAGFIIIFVISIVQWKFLKEDLPINYHWVALSIISLIVGIFVIFLINMVFELHFEILIYALLVIM
jgi:hypothetical protein